MDKQKLIEFLNSEIVRNESDKSISWMCKRLKNRINAGTFDEAINYKQAWKDLKNKFIDDISFEGSVDVGDLKKVMDEVLIDYT